MQVPHAPILLGTAVSAVIPQGLSSLANKGPHGFSEILYAFTQAAASPIKKIFKSCPSRLERAPASRRPLYVRSDP